MIFLPKRSEINFINSDKSQTIPEIVIQTNRINAYYIKLYKTIRTSLPIENPKTCHVSDVLITTNNFICQFNWLWVLDNLQLTMIRDVYDQIATRYPGYQKTISFIAWDYYCPGLKKMI